MIAQLLREPLLYFLAAGAVLFALADWIGDEGNRRIVVTDAQRARIADQWQLQMGRPPTDAEATALLDQWIREEVYYREALARGLDTNDVVVRRRLVQKLMFLTEDLATLEPPDQDALRAHHQAHQQRYTQPGRFSFVHRYFSSDLREHAEADARAALAALDAGEGTSDPIEGDAFMLPRSYLERSQAEISELFGREFAAHLFRLPEGRWQGPVRSAYGWHLVRLEQRRPARLLAFDEVAERVAADLEAQRRREANEAFYHSLLERYEIVQP